MPEVSEDVRRMMAQSLEQARSAFDQYLQLMDRSMSRSPWGEMDLTKVMRGYAEQNVASAFAFADRLIHAKNFEDLIRIQTEFLQSQMAALGEQAKGIGGAASKAAAEAVKIPIKPGS